MVHKVITSLIMIVISIGLKAQIANSKNIDFVTIIEKGKEAKFLMGATEEELKNQPHRKNDSDYYYDDETAHWVTLTIPYVIGKYEITNQQFVDIMNYALENNMVKLFNGDLCDNQERKLIGISSLVDHKYLGVQHRVKIENEKLKVIKGKERWPVHAVTWIGAITFCNVLSKIEMLDPVYNLKDITWNDSKNGYRLPTEAEWEYAARENSRNTYAWGNKFDAQHSCSADFNDSTDWKILFTPVGYFDGTTKNNFKTEDNSSPFGVYDMTGNVWKWCWDWYSRTYFQHSPEVDPKGPANGETRPPYDMTEPTKVWRGCGFAGTAEYSRITKRWSSSNQMAINEIGFRVARTLK